MIETITRAEQVELSNYIENIKRMKSLSDKLDEKYYDEKVATYALNAHIDASNVIEEVTDIIENNFDLFFDCKKLHPMDCDKGTHHFDGLVSDTLKFYVKGFIIHLCIQSRAIKEAYLGEGLNPHFSVARWGVHVAHIVPYKEEGERSIGSDLIYVHSAFSDPLITIDEGDKHTALEWARFKEMADNTRLCSARLLKHLKDFLNEKYEKIKKDVEKKEVAMDKNLKCPVYQKVSR